MLTTLDRNRVFAEGTRLLEGAFQLDHSTSVRELGSIFSFQDNKPLQQLKRRLAAAYGAPWCFPSTHGTTILNILSLLSVCPPGGRVLVNRDAHSSVTAAMIHGGFHPRYLVPPHRADLGLSIGPTIAHFREALRSERTDCIFLTSPNYFGIVGELAEIIQIAHERGIPVVVDAAHAPHFHFCRALPDGAEDLGADLVAQSTHKVATALSQGSLLVINNERFIEPLYEHVNELGFVSTSFSYPILASIELGVAQMVEHGDALWTETIERADRFRGAMKRLDELVCFGREEACAPGFRDFDPTRVTVDVSRTGLTGLEFARRLNEERIYPEMATLQHVLFLLTPGTTTADLTRLEAAMTRIVAGSPHRPRVPGPPPPPLPQMAVIPRVAKFSPKQPVPLRHAIGEVSGETVATYPPGAPVIAAGEIVSAEVIEYLRAMVRDGAVLRGASDPYFETLRVLSC